MNISDPELKTLLRSNRALLQKQNEAIRDLKKETLNLNAQYIILNRHLGDLLNSQYPVSDFQVSLNKIIREIQSEETKERIKKE